MSKQLPFDEIETSSQKIQGILDRITFLNKQNGYTVARLQIMAGSKVSGDSQLITVVGYLNDVPVGSTLSLSGQWVKDARFGQQFKVHRYKLLKPNTLNGIERYLGSGLIKGIGPQYAARIVKEFGLKTIEMLDKEPERLNDVAGLGKKRVDLIKKAWMDQREVHQVMVFLQSHGISSAYAVRIYKFYGKASLKVVKENPYRLAEDIWGIGFRIADSIAQSLGVPTVDARRTRAGLLFALNEAAKDGHCYCDIEYLLELTVRLLDLSPVSSELIKEQIPSLALDEKVVVDRDRVYLTPLWYAEKGTAENLLHLYHAPGNVSSSITFFEEQTKEAVDKCMALTLSKEQYHGIRMALNHKVCVLTGGPGTGKSTIIKGLIGLLEQQGISYSLAAPTGRAAKRLDEACGRKATTIHRLLEFDPSIMGFKRNRDNPLKVDLIVIDEASMMDILLANSLLKAIPQNASLLLVGDVDQLPSVGPGNVLRNIIDSENIPVVHLSQIYRQGPGSLISLNASLINQGKNLEVLADYKGEKDFYIIFRNEKEEVENEILSLCSGRLTRKYGFDPIRDIQVLAPMRKGVIGTINLNSRLQEELNPDSPRIDIRSQRFCRGDKVMQVRNNYDKEVFNGDLGIIEVVNQEEQIITVRFDERSVSYDSSDIDELMLAYATTVHKSQGSEFPCVIIPVHTTHYTMLQRNLFYTAVTRGKKLVILIGSKKAINIAIKNNRTENRNTYLKERLIKGFSA